MIDSTTGKPDRGVDVFGFEVGHFIKDLLRRKSCQEQIEDVCYADAHAANAGPPTALFGIEGDAFLPVCHSAVGCFEQGAVSACTPVDIYRLPQAP